MSTYFDSIYSARTEGIARTVIPKKQPKTNPSKVRVATRNANPQPIAAVKNTSTRTLFRDGKVNLRIRL